AFRSCGPVAEGVDVGQAAAVAPAATAEICANEALANPLRLVDMSTAILHGDEAIDLPQRSFTFFAPGVCLRRNQRSEPFALRYDASGFCRDETAGHHWCNP